MAVGYTPGSPEQVATDIVGGAHYQIVKIDLGGAGTSSSLSAANPLPISGSYLEDSQHASGDRGLLLLGVRQDADVSPVDVSGDYQALQFNQIGRLKVSSLPGDIDQISGSITANGQSVQLDTKRLGSACVMVSGTFAGINLAFEGSLDGTNWFGIQAARTTGGVTESTSGALSATPAYAWNINAVAYAFLRVRATSFTSGTMAVTWKGGANSTEPAPTIASVGQKTSALSLPVVLASDQAVLSVRTAPLTGTDRSVTATTTSAQLMAANTSRTKFFVKNDSTIDVWINFGATAVATAGGGNMKIAAGGYFEFAGSSSAINIIAASTTAAVTAREF